MTQENSEEETVDCGYTYTTPKTRDPCKDKKDSHKRPALTLLAKLLGKILSSITCLMIAVTSIVNFVGVLRHPGAFDTNGAIYTLSYAPDNDWLTPEMNFFWFCISGCILICLCALLMLFLQWFPATICIKKEGRKRHRHEHSYVTSGFVFSTMFLVIGFVVMGMAGLLGFISGMMCFFTAIIVLLFHFIPDPSEISFANTSSTYIPPSNADTGDYNYFSRIITPSQTPNQTPLPTPKEDTHSSSVKSGKSLTDGNVKVDKVS